MHEHALGRSETDPDLTVLGLIFDGGQLPGASGPPAGSWAGRPRRENFAILNAFGLRVGVLYIIFIRFLSSIRRTSLMVYIFFIF